MADNNYQTPTANSAINGSVSTYGYWHKDSNVYTQSNVVGVAEIVGAVDIAAAASIVGAYNVVGAADVVWLVI